MSQQALDSISEWIHPFPAAIAPAAKSLQNEQFGQSEPTAFLRLTPTQLCNSGCEWISSFNRISPLLSKLLFTTSYHVQLIKTREEKSSQTSVLGKPTCCWINQTMTKNNEKTKQTETRKKKCPCFFKTWRIFQMSVISPSYWWERSPIWGHVEQYRNIFYIFLPRLLETRWICFDSTYFSLDFPGYY